MKKILAVILIFTCVMALSMSVFAEGAVKSDVKNPLKDDIKALKTELQGLCSQATSLREQAAAKRGIIRDLIKSNKEAKAKEKLQAAKELKAALKVINEQIQSLREVKKGLWVEVKNARTIKDFETVKAKLTQIIEQKKAIIVKINDKLGVLDQIIAALS